MIQKKGLIARINDTKNNRLVRKTDITKSGEEMLETLTRRFQPYHQKMWELFTEEDLHILKSSLKKIRDAISQIVEIQI